MLKLGFIHFLKKKGPLLALFLAMLAIDQIVKQWTLSSLTKMSYHEGYPYAGVGVFKNFLGIEFSLVHATNLGAAWSLFSDYPNTLLWVRICLIFVLFYFLTTAGSTTSKLPWVLILSGAVSNVIDHFVYGHVIDMFHFILWGYDYPVFNVADSLIFIGALLLIIKPGNGSWIEQKSASNYGSKD